ncbi:MAG: uroporphyrinogen-III C-methyltransferase [bacterium]
MSAKYGKVYLVGAGPGDPGLLTLKGFDLLSKAQVIFYDNLVNPELLRHAPNSTRRVYVGKRGEGSSADQAEIEDQIVKAARAGKIVVRLKGGDPFIFGRGGEEAERLAKEKIPFEIVPGVTSAVAAPAYAGIPLTHRDFTQTVAFVTGHRRENQDTGETLDWGALAKMGTLVFVMGVKTLRQNMEALIQAGRDPKTPVAIIRWGTYPRQKTFVGTISDVADTVDALKLMPPAVIVVGEIVGLRENIRWFESRPLFGKRILVTRARAQASEFSKRLRVIGAEVIEIPTIEIVPPRSLKPLDQALSRLKKYEWVLFTSVNGVHAFFKRLIALGRDVRELASCRLGAVGEATAKALQEYSLKADAIPDAFTGKALAKYFSKNAVRGKKILIPRAQEGAEEWVENLRKKGARVEVVTAYENRLPRDSKKRVEDLSQKTPPDLAIFASSSAVRNFSRLLPLSQKAVFLAIPALCIGSMTEKSARDLGFQAVLKAKQATLESLIQATLRFFS